MLFIGSAANAAVSSSPVNEWEELGSGLCLLRQQLWDEKERKETCSCRAVALHRDEKAAADCSAQDRTWQPEKAEIKVVWDLVSFQLVPKSVFGCEWVIAGLIFLQKALGWEILEMHASFALLNNKSQVTASLCASVSHKIKRRQYYLLH